MVIKNLFRTLSLFFIVLYLGACASGTTLVTGTKRTATNFEQVRIYQVPPTDYEVIARVEASSEMGLTDQQSLDFALEEVKKQAAKVGANGVILNAVGKESTGGFGNFFSNGYGGGFFVGGDSYAQKISGTAVYVK